MITERERLQRIALLTPGVRATEPTATLRDKLKDKANE